MSVSQPARYGEEWDDDRVRGYLNRVPADNENADFYALMTAYKHMRANDFERFIAFFREAGRDVHARNLQGQSLLDIVRTHAKATEFVAILEAVPS